MTTRFRIKKRGADGTFGDIADGENVAPYNAFLYTMFSELEIEMNNELVRNPLAHTVCKCYFCRWTAPSSTINFKHI